MHKYLKDIRIPIKKSGLGLIVITAALVLGGSQWVVKAEPENEGSTNPLTTQSVK